MDRSILDAACAELHRLRRKADGIERMLDAYADEASLSEEAASTRLSTATPSTARTTDRFGSYGGKVVDAAVAALSASDGQPVSTRAMVELVEQNGVEIRGKDKGNALSALLSRSSAIQSNGRMGWTIARSNETGAVETAPAIEDVDASSHDSRTVNDLLG